MEGRYGNGIDRYSFRDPLITGQFTLSMSGRPMSFKQWLLRTVEGEERFESAIGVGWYPIRLLAFAAFGERNIDRTVGIRLEIRHP